VEASEALRSWTASSTMGLRDIRNKPSDGREWSQSPGIKNPIYVAIRRPTRSNRRRNPRRTVNQSFTPFPVFIDITVANNVAGYVSCVNGLIEALIADLAPHVKTILPRKFVNFGLQRTRPENPKFGVPIS
jgi:hypothetical protein